MISAANGVAQRQGGADKMLQSLSRNFYRIASHTFRAQPCPLEPVLGCANCSRPIFLDANRNLLCQNHVNRLQYYLLFSVTLFFVYLSWEEFLPLYGCNKSPNNFWGK
jgi:hypothetical protein